MAGDRTPSVEDKTPSVEEKQATYAHTADAETGYTDKERPVDLTKPNVEGRLRNPLSGVPRQTLLRDVDAFVAEKGIEEERELFHKAALVAQSPTRYNDLDMLDDADRNILEREQTHRWSHPVTLYVTILICSVGAATQGWDQTGSNGANLSFPAEFSLAGTERGEWLVGLINAAPYIASAVFGCWLSDPLNNFFGRRGTIFITALILIATPIASGFTHSWQTLFVVRLILGIGMGAKGATVPIFAAENSPTTIRGALVMSWQLWTAFGIFLGFCANAAVIDTGAIAWRLQLGSAFIPAVPLALGIFFVPESPRWLMKKNRYQEAYKSLCRLRFTRLQAARDLYYIHVQLEEEKKIIQGASYIQRFTELFTIPRVRRATLAASTVMLGQQMCGINIIAFYSSTVFVQAGSTERQALYASIGFGAVNFVFAFPALITIDRFGRRSLLLFAFPFMALTLLGAGLCFLAPNMPNPDYPATSDLAEIATKGKLAGIALFIYIFTAFYSTSEGPVPFTLSAEVFPLAQREQGMSWAVATCLFWAAVLSITFPRMLSQMMPVGAFCFYAGLNVIALVLIFFFVPETAGRSLEELDQVFNMPTATFARHQVRHSLPYFFKRFVCFNKNAKPVPLYKTDDGQEFLG